jgi:aerobic carbon-monoxide dehydrogenase medium subunit
MKSRPFVYHNPESVEQALAILASVSPQGGRILAGGQSLVPMMALRLADPTDLVDINGIRDLDFIRIEKQSLAVGATARHSYFHRPRYEDPLGRLLADVVRSIAHYPIRTRGTMCGSLANADPASEWCLTATVLGAELEVRSKSAKRTILASEFITGPMSTSLEADEMLIAVRYPLLPADAVFGFYEFSRRIGDFALAMSLVTFCVRNGLIVAPRVGVGGVENSPRQLTEAEKTLLGQAPSDLLFQRCAEVAAETVTPSSDAQIPEANRRKLVRTVVHRALQKAARTIAASS